MLAVSETRQDMERDGCTLGTERPRSPSRYGLSGERSLPATAILGAPATQPQSLLLGSTSTGQISGATVTLGGGSFCREVCPLGQVGTSTTARCFREDRGAEQVLGMSCPTTPCLVVSPHQKTIMFTGFRLKLGTIAARAFHKESV